ncbi:hypothetical protein [Sphingomonas sp. PP-CC-3G-468]|uniref:hypothetical protein n=1 Tax=Sphingomonas sp. PP-CC-3G-468 TaxID=2135656 RepID=UPI001FB55F7E|nr:hypothetical protein [Sphingomonas sp. PP-CC-3G-468]
MPGLMDVLARWFGGGRAEVPDQLPARSEAIQPALSIDDPRLPTASKSRIARLIALISDLEARRDESGALASTHAEVRQMRDVHVPRLIASYAEIPREHRAEIFRSTGQSASYNLNAGLDRMIARLEQLSRSLAQDDIDGFADNLRFIEQRYGRDDPLG